MIEKSLVFLQDEMNAYLTLTTGNDQFEVKISNVSAGDGKEMDKDNVVALTLVNVEEEYAYKDHQSYRVLTNGEKAKVSPDLKLNLYVMFSVHFNHYNVGLEYLSHIARFFQGKCYFDQKNSPRLDKEVSYLNMELYTMNFEQINQLWGALGGKYRPCLMYKVRMLTIQENLIHKTVTAAGSSDFGPNPIS